MSFFVLVSYQHSYAASQATNDYHKAVVKVKNDYQTCQTNFNNRKNKAAKNACLKAETSARLARSRLGGINFSDADKKPVPARCFGAGA